MRADQIALQMYSIRAETQHDMVGTLRRLAEIGFKNLEFAGYGDASVGDVRAALDDLGLRAIAAHVGLHQFAASATQVFDEMHTLGCQYVIVPYLPPERREADQAPRLAAQLNEWGAQAHAAGLTLGYHNHDFEFAPLDGSDFLTTLLAGTDPALVKLELDIYWALYAGRDPVALIRQYGARVPLLHMKDLAASEAREMTTVGAGVMPWPEILAAGQDAGVEWYVVEHDRPTDPLGDMERALRYLEARAE